jgi:SH3-like domain-containing protein
MLRVQSLLKSSLLASAMFLLSSQIMISTSAQATEAQAAVMGPSGLPLPRFVSLKSNRINLRVGPGRDYAVQWLYLKPGLPVEIIQEYDNWRRIRDSEGTEGWVLQTLLSGKRGGIAAPWAREVSKEPIPMFARAEETAALSASLEPGVLGKINACDGLWCTF